MVNAGELRPDGQGGFAWWPDDWTRSWKPMGAVPKIPVGMFGRFWEPYTCEQIASVVAVLREGHRLPGALQPAMGVGHEHVATNKWDPGPLFPIHGVRQAAFEPGIDPMAYQWFKGYARDAHYGEAWRRIVARNYWSGVQGETLPEADAWEAVSGVLRSHFRDSNAKPMGELVQVALQLLGYYAPFGDRFG